MLSPLLDEIASENKNIQLVKIDAEAEPQIAEKYNVNSLPTVLIFKDGQLTSTITGSRPKSEYLKAIL